MSELLELLTTFVTQAAPGTEHHREACSDHDIG